MPLCTHNTRLPARRGFTLIELSIVLVIIGLIVGGILVGQDLIRASEMRSVVSDNQKFDTAVMAFKGKYNCIPGDCNQATVFGLGANGDGNGHVGNFTTSTVDTAEGFLFWQHLGAANLVAGTYTGLAGGGGGRDTNIGSNVPASKITGVGYTAVWLDLIAHTSRFSVQGHWIMCGTENDFFGTMYETSGYAFTTQEAFSLDTKIDDGKPGFGQLISTYGYNFAVSAFCASTLSPTTSVYQTSLTNRECSLQFKMSF